MLRVFLSSSATWSLIFSRREIVINIRDQLSNCGDRTSLSSTSLSSRALMLSKSCGSMWYAVRIIQKPVVLNFRIS